MLQETYTITYPDLCQSTSGIKPLCSIIYACPAGLGGKQKKKVLLNYGARRHVVY